MKILYLYGSYWHSKKMSIGRLLYGEAVGRHSGVELRFSGTGWPNWNDSLSVTDNIARMGWTPDWIWVYKGADYPTLRDCRIPTFLIFNEANADKSQEEIEAANASLVGFHHETDAARWPNYKSFTIPHCCDVDESSQPHANRSVFCLASGVRADKIYPIRGRMMDLISSGRIPGVIRKHPGYRLADNASVRRQYEDYRSALRSARISLCCSSIYRYPLAKYVEAAAAGCLVIGDMPEDSTFANGLGRFIVPVSAAAGDDEISDTVLWWLARPEDAQERAAAGQEYVRQHLTTNHYAERLISRLGDV